MGLAEVRGIFQCLTSGLGQSIVADAAWVFLAGEIQQDVIYCLPHLGIICQGLKAETSRVPIGKFLSNGLEILLGIRKYLLLIAGVGHLTHRTVFLSHLLSPQVIAVQVPLIFKRAGRASKTETILLCFPNIPVGLPILCDSPTVFLAVVFHRGQAFQRAVLLHGRQKLPQEHLKFQRIELFVIVGI